MSADNVNTPKHYTSDPSGIECIQVVRHRTFNIGNAIKYLWRMGLKVSEGQSDAARIEDANKALWYICDEIGRLGGKITCRHPGIVGAIQAELNAAPRKAEPKPAKLNARPTDAAPLWVQLVDTVDDEEYVCGSCRCPWWHLPSPYTVARCAKCGVRSVNLRGVGDVEACEFKIAAKETDKPEV